jgi:hypothetical protein
MFGTWQQWKICVVSRWSTMEATRTHFSTETRTIVVELWKSPWSSRRCLDHPLMHLPAHAREHPDRPSKMETSQCLKDLAESMPRGAAGARCLINAKIIQLNIRFSPNVKDVSFSPTHCAWSHEIFYQCLSCQHTINPLGPLNFIGDKLADFPEIKILQQLLIPLWS